MLFLITWSIPSENRVQCLNAFSNMTPEDDLVDAGPNINVVGRWHRLSGSGGVCIASVENVESLNSWMLNWSPLCNINVEPVVEDASARASVREKPYFVEANKPQ